MVILNCLINLILILVLAFHLQSGSNLRIKSARHAIKLEVQDSVHKQEKIEDYYPIDKELDSIQGFNGYGKITQIQ